MSKLAGSRKRKVTTRINEKCKILKEVDEGETSASLMKRYGIPKQTLSGWIKEKAKI